MDEDTATISVEAARNAIARGADPKKIGAIYVGSESHPYAVKPTATIVAAAIGAGPKMTAADFEFACKAGTAAIQTCMGVVSAGIAETAMAIGADTSQGAPGRRFRIHGSGRRSGFRDQQDRPHRGHQPHVLVHDRYAGLLEKGRRGLSRGMAAGLPETPDTSSTCYQLRR